MRTDTRNLAERKHSVQLRIGELRKALDAAEKCEAEIDAEIALTRAGLREAEHVAAE